VLRKDGAFNLDGEPLKRKREWGKPRSDIPVEANLNPAYGPIFIGVSA
jgi:hypothetical protein